MSDINHGEAKDTANYTLAYDHSDYDKVLLSRAYLALDAKLTEIPSDDFSRGESYGADCCARLINDVLDGKTDGVMCEPLGSARQRLIDHLADLEAIYNAHHAQGDAE